MIEQKQKSYSRLWPRRGRLRVVVVALAAVFTAAIVTVPSTFSEDAVQPLRTDRGPEPAEPAVAEVASVEQGALVVEVGGAESAAAVDLTSFESNDSSSEDSTEDSEKDSDEDSDEASEDKAAEDKSSEDKAAEDKSSEETASVDKENPSADRSNGQQGVSRRSSKAAAQTDGDDSTDQTSAATSTTSPIARTRSTTSEVTAGSPTTAAPTTAAPTTAAPTTDAPTTAAPTTAAPTTAAPTTAAPTTAAPTTAAPTTAAPTTAAPTTQPPSNGNLSGAAIRVGFENHPVGGPYNTARQEYDWDDIQWNRHWTDRSRIVDNPTRVGGKALQILYPGGGHNGGAYASWEIPPRQEYYLSYYVMFKPGFDFEAQGNSGGKLPGLAAGALCSGGKTCDGTNGFTARYVWRDQGRGELYLYDIDRTSGWGRSLVFEANGRNFFFETGKWHHLVQRIRTNSSANVSDGLAQVWMNGVQVVDQGGLRFQTNGDMIDVFFFSTFFGGSGPSWEPKWDSYTYFDEIIISPNRADVGL